jgi:hypothetical protein
MSTFLQETENLKTRLAIWITLKSEADPPKAAWRREPTTEQSSRTLHRPKDDKQKEFLLRETRREIDWLMEFPPNLCLEIQTRLKIKNGGRSHEERNQYLGGGWVGGGALTTAITPAGRTPARRGGSPRAQEVSVCVDTLFLLVLSLSYTRCLWFNH